MATNIGDKAERLGIVDNPQIKTTTANSKAKILEAKYKLLGMKNDGQTICHEQNEQKWEIDSCTLFNGSFISNL